MLLTLILVGINLGVYLYLGGGLKLADTSTMTLSLYNLNQGEYYRIVTNLFYHFDFAHLGYNMLFLLIFGSRCEEIFGKVRFLIIYFSSGIFSSLSILLYPPGSVIGGASGAIFGLLGAVLIAQRKFYAHGYVTSLLYALLFFLIAATTGFLAHMLGLIVGFVLGYIFTYEKEE